ncbi:glycosyltransferase family 4 protein [Streptomyces sp. NPDC006879]|uniref:glycosyltransferase family 4 protein n=1 Tax=Streptomyces sp. NPDC006879 TaxID=3364767 RepID=UPI003678573A
MCPAPTPSRLRSFGHVSSTPAQPYGKAPLRTVQVLGGGSAGSSVHVRSLSAGLAARGVRVTVCAPVESEGVYDFTGAGAHFAPVPRRTGPVAVAALRQVCTGADVVHAHGLQAAARAAVAVHGQRVPLVVTWHSRPYAQGARAPLARLLERRVARAAVVVLGTSSDLVDRARSSGARDARLAPVTVPAPRRAASPAQPDKTRADLGAVARPLLIAVGSLEAHRGYDTLFDAARAWCRQDPVPLLVIAGEGSKRVALAQRIEAEQLPICLLGRREDVSELLAVADVAVLPSSWESRSLLAQEALRAGVPLVATAVGGIPELVGDAAVLVPYANAAALASAVCGLLDDPQRRAGLASAGRRQAATWPTEDDTVAQVLSVYDELSERGRVGP